MKKSPPTTCTRSLLIAALLLYMSLPGAIAQTTAPEEIVVSGRLPGPPLWRVSNGDHHLYIFGYYSPIPKEMQWQSDNVESVLAKSQEYLRRPSGGVSVSPLLMLNPINIVRGVRLMKRLSRNADGKRLDEVISPELYQRYLALKARYLPNDNDDDIELQRPMLIASNLPGKVYSELGLVSAQNIDSRLRRIARRNDGLVTTETETDMKLKGGYGEIADRLETMMNSISLDAEIACLEWEITRLETSADQLVNLANSWAQGYVDELRALRFIDEAQSPCNQLFADSSEGQTVTDLFNQLTQQWLDSAENALRNNESTFAVLDIGQLLVEDGVLSKLEAKGYTIREP